MTGAPVVELDRVGRNYRRGDEEVHALVDLSLTLDSGELVALVGPSGCGKSTALNLVAAVDRPDRGRVTVCGVDIATASENELVALRRRSIGMVFQAFHLVPHLTVEENVSLPLALDGRRDPDRVLDLIDRVGLGHRARHYPSELSGGEQQRTAVARALVHRPRVVVADEPTGNLDSRTGAAVIELLDELRRSEGAALLLATHDARVAGAADRVCELADGRLVGRRS
ncbi:MAG: ABC transporter ATP-binding protein [Thermoanaerobaculales bacterium]|jgi:putative ABC transport system ATP-binding protein|nr:ABC transporter ATP-binding protein [Thermoanaerobaculales bacterium]